jgi:acyl carrier protein
MPDDRVLAELTEVFREVFDDDTIELRPEMTADDIEGWDSMQNIRLMLTIERKFDLRLPSTKVGNLKNVGDLTELVRTCL